MDRNGESEEPENRAGKPDSERIDRAWKSLSYASIGIEMAVAIVLGWAFGRYLDGKFGTEPYLMLIFLLLGIAAGFKGLIRAAKRAQREIEAP